MGVGHRLDDLSECLDGSVGVGLQVLPGEILDVAEPVVLDGLVEKGRVGLVAVVGLGVLLEVLSELVDERAVVAGLDLGDSAGWRLGASRLMDDERSDSDGGPELLWFSWRCPRSRLWRSLSNRAMDDRACDVLTQARQPCGSC